MRKTYPIIQMFLSTGMVEFSGTKVINATLVEEIDSLGATLPYNTIEFDVLSTDQTFSIFGTFNLLTQRIPIMVYESIDGTSVFLGRFYLDDWENTRENRYSFRAIDILGVLSKTPFDGLFVERQEHFVGPVGFVTPWSALGIFRSLLVPTGTSFEVDDDLKEQEFQGWLAPGNYRQALQQMCFALGATISSARSESLQIDSIPLPVSTYDTEITDAVKGSGQTVTLLPLITHLELISHDYIEATVKETIFEKILEQGSHKIIFNRPYSEITIVGPGYISFTLATENGDEITTEGGDLIEVGGEYVFIANCLYLEVSTEGLVTITGYPWSDYKTSHRFTETGADAFQTKNARSVEDAMMVRSVSTSVPLERMRDYYRLRYSLKLRLYSSDVKPGDILLVTAQYGNRILAIIQKMTTDLTGGNRMTVECLGKPYE